MSPKIGLALFLLLVNGAFYPLYAAPAMVEKDLFSMDRKPPAPQSEDTYPSAGGRETAVENIVLDGVIIRNKDKKAILRIKNFPAGKVDDAGNPLSPFVAVREGGTVKGYRVIRIKTRSVSLQKDGRTYTIDLFADNTGGAPASPAPGATAQKSPTAARELQPYDANGPLRFPGIAPKFNPGKPPQTPPPPMK